MVEELNWPYDWLELTPRAQIALDALSRETRTIVLRRIEEHLNPMTYRRNALIHKLQDFEDVYVLRATRDLRVLFRRDKEFRLVTVIDIVRRGYRDY